MTSKAVTFNQQKRFCEARQQNELQKSSQNGQIIYQHQSIKVSDKVLLKQKVTKSKRPYDPFSYDVIEVDQKITAQRGHEILTRDTQKRKHMKKKDANRFTPITQSTQEHRH